MPLQDLNKPPDEPALLTIAGKWQRIHRAMHPRLPDCLPYMGFNSLQYNGNYPRIMISYTTGQGLDSFDALSLSDLGILLTGTTLKSSR